jgi:hypothetical protein
MRFVKSPLRTIVLMLGPAVVLHAQTTSKPVGFIGPDARQYEAPLLSITPTPSSGQQGAKADADKPAPQTGAGRKAGAVTPSKPGEFYDKKLALHFNYPTEMSTLDPHADIERGRQNISGASGANDPEHTEGCDRPLLDAELPQDNAPHRAANLDGVWVDDSKESKESRKPEPISAHILMMEVVRDCLPQELQKNENDALGSIALSLVSKPGIKRMPTPMWYEIDKQKIHMNSGAGRPIVDGRLASAPIIIMSMATEWRGHLLAWVFTSNDTEVFNGITKSLVQFGDGPWGPMLESNVGPRGSGAPMTIAPK